MIFLSFNQSLSKITISDRSAIILQFPSLIPETSSFQNCKSLRNTSIMHSFDAKLLQNYRVHLLFARQKQIPAKLIEFRYYNAAAKCLRDNRYFFLFPMKKMVDSCHN